MIIDEAFKKYHRDMRLDLTNRGRAYFYVFRFSSNGIASQAWKLMEYVFSLIILSIKER